MKQIQDGSGKKKLTKAQVRYERVIKRLFVRLMATGLADARRYMELVGECRQIVYAEYRRIYDANVCAQCGKQWTQRCCGPTHAAQRARIEAGRAALKGE